jgi:hypothetical protein
MPSHPLHPPRARRPGRRSTPSCRGGVSSLLRLAQPAAGRAAGVGVDVTAWLARAASVLAPVGAPALPVRPSEFAPSQWLVGH